MTAITRRWVAPVVAGAALVAVALLAGRAGGGARPAALDRPSATVVDLATPCVPKTDDEVLVQSFTYCPASLTVAAGTEVRWVDNDAAPHTVTSASDAVPFESGSLGQRQSYAVRFDRPGTYAYYCRFHPGMRAEVRVTAA